MRDKQIIKDTAEYNYNLGYLKAIEDFEKIINKEKNNQHNKDCIVCWNLVEGFKQQLKELGSKK